MDTYGSPEGYLYNLQAFTSSEARKMWRESIKAKWGHTCAYCGSDRDITLDHIVPRAKGGSDHTTNLLACCGSCNADKAHEDWIIWFIQKPFFTEARRQLIEDWMFPKKEVNPNLYRYSPRRNTRY